MGSVASSIPFEASKGEKQLWLQFLVMLLPALIPGGTLTATASTFRRGSLTILTLLLVILIIETVQQLSQDQQNWVAYRSTCETLKHEKYLFLSSAGPYMSAEKPLALLAEGCIPDLCRFLR
jgi:hypothetical protein